MSEKLDPNDPNLIKRFLDDPDGENRLWAPYYKEKPVDIEIFIRDPQFLGNSNDCGERIYKVWYDALKEAFDNDAYTEIVFTGACGTGKTSAASIGLAYIVYRTLCMRDPHSYYGAIKGKPLTVVFFSMSVTLSKSTNFQTFQGMIQTSPWFQQRGHMSGTSNLQLKFPNIDYRLSAPRTGGYGTVGGDVIAGVLDELNTPGESANIRVRTFHAYESAVRRLENRFMSMGYIPGLKLFMCASKDEELAFVDTHIEKRKGSKHILVKDINVWEAKPHKCSDKMFPVAIGNAFLPSMVIGDGESPVDLAKFTEAGYQIELVPIDFYEAFCYDVIGGLRDIAGLTVSGIRKYKLFPSEKYAELAMDKTLVDPVSKNLIYTELSDEVPWIDYIDLSKITRDLNIPSFIHMDIGLAHDAMGIAMSHVCDWRIKDIQGEDGRIFKEKVPVIKTDFVLRIKAKDGANIPLDKMRRLILDLREAGFRIAKVTSDLRLLSADTMQVLNRAGIPSEHLSVDRPVLPYLLFRDLVFEKRWICHYHPWLYFEMKHIEYNRDKEKIDHPDKVNDKVVIDNGTQIIVVSEGTKDMLDAVVGSVYQAVLLGRSPVDVKMHIDAIKAVQPHKREDDFWRKTDWFIDGKSKKELAQPVLVDPNDRIRAINAAVTKLRLMKNMGQFRAGGISKSPITHRPTSNVPNISTRDTEFQQLS